MSDKAVDISLYSIPADYDAVAGMTQQENTKVSLQVAMVGGGCKACPGICDNILRGFGKIRDSTMIRSALRLKTLLTGL